uniref:Uncharacterized protein n=1 Tax=Sphaerodactylus townsendi TaxID=933632 RepID=A0ACB8FDB5_9SAUR
MRRRLKSVIHADDLNFIGELHAHEEVIGEPLIGRGPAKPNEVLEEDFIQSVENLWDLLLDSRTQQLPLKRAVFHMNLKEGGLSVPDPALLFTSRFVASNLMRSSGDQLKWALFSSTWQENRWMRAWSECSSVKPRRTQEALQGLPDYLRELTCQLNTYAITPVTILGAQQPTKGTPAGCLYKAILEDHYLQPYRQALQAKPDTPTYLVDPDEPKYRSRWFTDTRLPKSLHEVRWRAYHRVMQVAGTEKWRPDGERLCSRPGCADRTLGPVPTETVEHMVLGCPTSKQLYVR